MQVPHLGRTPEGPLLDVPMKRVDGFAAGEKADEGWVVVKVKLRPSWLEAMKTEATRETDTLNRRVFVSDLIRDAIRAFMLIRRILPTKKTRFLPSKESEFNDL